MKLYNYCDLGWKVLIVFVLLFYIFTSKVYAAILGDISFDGKVNIIDIGIIVDNYGSSGSVGNMSDLNSDGRVDIIDLGIVIDNYSDLHTINTPQPTVIASLGNIWISSEELSTLPTSGPAWDRIKYEANGSWGNPDLKNQDNKYGVSVMAGALVYSRTGDVGVRAKVRDGIITAKRTMDEQSEWGTTNGALSLGRQLGAFIISADLIDLKNFDNSAYTEFREYISVIRTKNVGTHGRWKNLTYTCENSANNWGTFACASRIAADLYIGDTSDLDRTANIIKAWMGDRQFYPADAPGVSGYFQPTADGVNSGWACNEATLTAINPTCTKSNINIDGAIVEDAVRGGVCCTLQGSGVSYSWEALQGVFVSAELLYRTGRYGDPYIWSNSALKRAMNYMSRSGWGITSPSYYVPWIANKRYGTAYPTNSTGSGRIVSWTDWTHK